MRKRKVFNPNIKNIIPDPKRFIENRFSYEDFSMVEIFLTMQAMKNSKLGALSNALSAPRFLGFDDPELIKQAEMHQMQLELNELESKKNENRI